MVRTARQILKTQLLYYEWHFWDFAQKQIKICPLLDYGVREWTHKYFVMKYFAIQYYDEIF